MSGYAKKLSSIAEKRKRLLEEEQKLTERRKKEIGLLAERLGLLTSSDSLIAGLFLEAQAALNSGAEKTKLWESHGAQFLKAKNHGMAAQESAG